MVIDHQIIEYKDTAKTTINVGQHVTMFVACTQTAAVVFCPRIMYLTWTLKSLSSFDDASCIPLYYYMICCIWLPWGYDRKENLFHPKYL